jgi:anhydro-N-acetylmuramic acid kinase
MEIVYTLMGLMSGTSLDGLDVAICSFKEKKDIWSYKILFAKTIPYDKIWKERLAKAHKLSSNELINLDRQYGNFLARVINEILDETGLKPQIVASHGHTVFHVPSQGYTFQVGYGANISAGTGLPVVCDFRSTDIALGGQGAPLVPAGDKLLFTEYDSCLNLGGFANISFDIDGQRNAMDICPVNIILNRFANSYGCEFDKNGNIGRKGKTNSALLSNLDDIDFYKSEMPKSLSREWLEGVFIPLTDSAGCSEQDKFHTVYQHIAKQIGKIIEDFNIEKVLVTGGGTYNGFLMELIGKLTNARIIIPDKNTIEFKEALVFAFLGLLKSLNRINCYASVTGARSDSCCGVMYF